VTCAAPAVTWCKTVPGPRHRLSKFLPRHGRTWRAGSAWTQAYDRWLASRRFEEPTLTTTFGHCRTALLGCEARLDSVEADLPPLVCPAWPSVRSGERLVVAAMFHVKHCVLLDAAGTSRRPWAGSRPAAKRSPHAYGRSLRCR
jgi:hypothetical protein